MVSRPVTSRNAATLNCWPSTAALATSSRVCREQDASLAVIVWARPRGAGSGPLPVTIECIGISASSSST